MLNFLFIRYNSYDLDTVDYLPTELVPEYYKHTKIINEYIRSKDNVVLARLMPGEMVIVDNQRVCHGRTSFTGYRNMVVEKFCTFLFVEVVTILDSEKTEQVKSSLLQQIIDAELVDLVPGKIKLRVPIRRNEKNATVSQHLGNLFKDMDQIKRGYFGTIKYYSIAQMTLEQIFIALSNQKLQVDETLKESLAATSFVQ